MENNGPPPPPLPPAFPPVSPPPSPLQCPLLMYNYNPPYNADKYMHLITCFPLNITVYNFNMNTIYLYFNIFNNSISINTIHAPQNDNNNNVAAQDHDIVLNDVADDDNNAGGGGDYDNGNGRAEFFDLSNEFDEVDDNNNETLGLHVFTPDVIGLRQYGITIPTLPTLPAYINISNNYCTISFVLLINSDTTVYLIDPSPPLPLYPLDDAENDVKNETICQYMAMPFILTLPFNIANTNTIISIFIRFTQIGIFIQAATRIGVTDYAAYFSGPPQM
ncbi:hypothetical protein Lal_00021836 [Lupinus albus]|nr:hypothetical protein Lal_00021836 [Lupinus albus]